MLESRNQRCTLFASGLLTELLRGHPLLNGQPFDVTKPPVAPMPWEDGHVEHGCTPCCVERLKVGRIRRFPLRLDNVPTRIEVLRPPVPSYPICGRCYIGTASEHRLVVGLPAAGWNTIDRGGCRFSCRPRAARSPSSRWTHTWRRSPCLEQTSCLKSSTSHADLLLEVARPAFWCVHATAAGQMRQRRRRACRASSRLALNRCGDRVGSRFAGPAELITGSRSGLGTTCLVHPANHLQTLSRPPAPSTGPSPFLGRGGVGAGSAWPDVDSAIASTSSGLYDERVPRRSTAASGSVDDARGPSARPGRMPVTRMRGRVSCDAASVTGRYADDFVVMCDTNAACEQAEQRIREVFARLGVELHPEKTRRVDLSRGGCRFLGCHLRKRTSGPIWEQQHRRVHDLQRWPSQRAMQRIRQRVKALTPRAACHRDMRETIAQLNPVLRGWGAYFRTGNAAIKVGQVDRYVAWRLRRLLVRRAGRHLRPVSTVRWTEDFFHALGLHRLRGTIGCPAAA